MILFKSYRERLRLLEYENEIITNKLKQIEKQLKPLMPPPPQPRIIREDGWNLSYNVLRKKYRNQITIFDNGL